MKKQLAIAAIALLGVIGSSEIASADPRGHGHGNGHGYGRDRDHHRDRAYHKAWNNHNKHFHRPAPVVVNHYPAHFYSPYNPPVAYYSYYNAYPRPVYYTRPTTSFSFNF